MIYFPRPVVFGILYFLIAASPAWAADIVVTCDDISGERIDFVTEKKKFEPNKDGMTGSQLTLTTRNDGLEGEVTLTAIKKSDARTATAKVSRINSTDHSTDYVGLMDGAAIVLSYYPKDKVMIYSEHGHFGEGAVRMGRSAKGKLFGMNCR